MKLGRILGGLGLAAAGIAAVLFFREPAARSADHLDSPATKADSTADINDLYTWVDGNNAVFVLTSKFDTTPTTKFSDKVQYVFHTASGPAYGAVTAPFDIIVTFDTNNKVQAWYGPTGYVTGDASATTGLASQDGKFKIYAGPRADPFFFNRMVSSTPSRRSRRPHPASCSIRRAAPRSTWSPRASSSTC